MNTKLFIGNLSYSVTDDQLLEVFSKIGPVVEAKVIFDRNTNRSRGFGFVTFEKEEDAQEALKQLNETELAGRTMYVNIANSKDNN